MGITVGKLGKKFGVSRTALLYYESIGLLKPSARSKSRYRQYTVEDAERLRFLLTLRDAGIPLGEIGALLPAGRADLSMALMLQINGLNHEIERLQQRQQIIIRLMKSINLPQDVAVRGRDYWAMQLQNAGLDGKAMHEWHIDFEIFSPQRHEEFLKMLEFTDEEITALRRKIRESKPKGEGK